MQNSGKDKHIPWISDIDEEVLIEDFYKDILSEIHGTLNLKIYSP